MKAYLLVAILGLAAASTAHATMYTCKDGDKVVFQSVPCPEPVDVVTVPRTIVRPVKQPERVQPPAPASQGLGGACTADGDCSKGRRCRKLEGKDVGACY